MQTPLETKPNFFSRIFNLSVLQQERWKWVDYLRGIAIILVVYRHTLIGIGRSGEETPHYLMIANMIFYSFRMPLFFIIAGMFIRRSIVKRKVNSLVATKFENLLYPYFVWCTIQITLQIIFIAHTNAQRSWVDYTYMLYHPRALDQFWYLPALFNVSFLYILTSVYGKFPTYMQLLVGIVFYYISPYFQSASIVSDFMEFYIFFAFGDFISRIFFQPSFSRFLNRNATLLLLIPVFVLIQLYYLSNDEYYYVNNMWGKTAFIFIAIIGCLTMAVLAFYLQRKKLLPFLRVVGYHSLYIYVIHVLVIAGFRIVFVKMLNIHNTPLLLFLGIGTGIIIPIIFFNLFVKDGPLRFLFFYSKKK